MLVIQEARPRRRWVALWQRRPKRCRETVLVTDGCRQDDSADGHLQSYVFLTVGGATLVTVVITVSITALVVCWRQLHKRWSCFSASCRLAV